MNLELGQSYKTRNGEYVVRIISLIGSWDLKHPAVGELYEMKGNARLPLEGIFNRYEHWSLTGRYLTGQQESDFDLVAVADPPRPKIARKRAKAAPADVEWEEVRNESL